MNPLDVLCAHLFAIAKFLVSVLFWSSVVSGHSVYASWILLIMTRSSVIAERPRDCVPVCR